MSNTELGVLLANGAVYFALSIMVILVLTLLSGAIYATIKMFRGEGLIYNKKYIVKKYEKQ